ncbi:hypothetical protein [Aureimonas altamirensis]|uniref:hypothetical protein n=1 Tax=Aureimonas altamirensis TaxID=370622 RepID=UPI0025525053|nr:hypothetical protein [Aureimonas altamirensis]
MADIQICAPGTILAATHKGTERPQFFEVTGIVSKGTVELRQIVTDENGSPVASAFIAPPFRASVGISIDPDSLATVWNTTTPPRP